MTGFEHWKVGYQGEPGAFSEMAVAMLLPGATAIPRRTFRSIFDDVASGALRCGLVPLENSQSGSISDTFDLLARSQVHIVGEVIVQVDQGLLAPPGARLDRIRRVLSHPQALAQCQEYLAHLDAEIIAVYDTAGAAKQIAQQGRQDEAAVASEHAATVYGLEVLARRIQTHPDNHTRFAAISRDPEPLGRANKTSLLFSTSDVPRALYRCLRPFAKRELNLSKIESRPLGHEPWVYRFFVDVETDVDESTIREAIDDLKKEAGFVRVLGSYPRWEPSA